MLVYQKGPSGPFSIGKYKPMCGILLVKSQTKISLDKHLSAFKIQKWFRKIAENPNHKSGICKRRVNAAYDKLFNIVENE